MNHDHSHNLNSTVPRRISVNQTKDCLSIDYTGDVRHQLPAEYLRVLSPSAEVRGHGKGQEVLQFGKRLVTIDKISQSGNYAIQIFFNDGSHTEKVEVEYPIGHRHRRKEGIPLLEMKFLNSLKDTFSNEQANRIYSLCLDNENIKNTSVNEFMDLFLSSD